MSMPWADARSPRWRSPGSPKRGSSIDTIAAIFQGGYDKLSEAGVALLGGHTVQDEEIKFGYAVTGAINPARILANAGAQVGDALILTKPIGTGVIGTAIKFNRAPADVVEAAIDSMRMLNSAAANVLTRFASVHACTDITGFGLIGHATEMATASQVTLTIRAAAVPLFAGVLDLVGRNRSGGMASNQDHFATGVQVGGQVSDTLLDLLFDPQTSGGLLVAVAEEDAQPLVGSLLAAGVAAAQIGQADPPGDKRVVVK